MSTYPTIDRFATALNTQVSLYNSYFHELNSHGIDCFAQQDFHDHINYCNPPFAVVGRLLSFIISHYPTAKFIVIVPMW